MQIFPNPVSDAVPSPSAVLLNPTSDQTIDGPFALIFKDGGVIVTQGLAINVLTVTSNYSPTVSDCSILANGTLSLLLPVSGIRVGQLYRIKNIGTGTITLSSTVNIDFSIIQTITSQGDSLDILWDGVQWWIMGSQGSSLQSLNQLQAMTDLLQLLVQEQRATKAAILATDNTLLPQDFDAASYSDLVTSETELS